MGTLRIGATGPRSPWVGIDPDIDPVRWARLLRRAHELALSKGSVSSILRSLVASSWRRATEDGVDPDGYAPTKLDARQTGRALERHPVSHLLPTVERMLSEATEDARCFLVLSDAEGVLLWANGHPRALEIAVGPGFLPGHLCSERAVGTNAVGTAITLDHPVQIFSAEHFNRRLHGLTCSAAPIHDPENGQIIGALNLSGSFRTGHPHSLSLVTAVCLLIESTLAREAAARDDRLRNLYFERVSAPHGRSAIVGRDGRVLAATPKGWLGPRLRVRADGSPVLPDDAETTERLGGSEGAFLIRPKRRGGVRSPTLRLDILGPQRVRISVRGDQVELRPRHSQIVLQLAHNPHGLSCEELRRRVFGPAGKAVTVRAELSRLRRVLGPILTGSPYRLEARVLADPEQVAVAVAAMQRDAATKQPGCNL